MKGDNNTTAVIGGVKSPTGKNEKLYIASDSTPQIALGKKGSANAMKISANDTAIAITTNNVNPSDLSANSITIGKGTTSASENTIAIGKNAFSEGAESVAIGPSGDDLAYRTQATGDYSVAIGASAQATHNQSVAIGFGAKTVADKQIVLGGYGDTVYIPGKLVVSRTTYLGIGNNDVKYPSSLWLKTKQGNDIKYGWITDSSDKGLGYGDGNTTKHDLGDGYTPWYSDRRLKNVGKAFTGGLEEIKKLEVFNYTFKKDPAKTPMVGVMAQDLQKIFPNAVFKGDDGFLRIRMEDMFYALVNSVKELATRFDNHDKKITELEKQNKELIKTISELEKRIAKLEK